MIRATDPTGVEVELNVSDKAFDVVLRPKGYRRIDAPAVEQAEEPVAIEVNEGLAALTKGELAEKAEGLGIEVPANLKTITKGDLITQIEQASETEEDTQGAA